MNSNVQDHRRTLCWVSLLAMGTFGALGPRITPSVAFVFPLRVGVLALAFLGALTLASGWPGERPVCGRNAGAWEMMPCVVIGGLLGAAFVAPWAAFPWLVLPALVITWAGWGRSRTPEIPGAGLATALLAAAVISISVVTVSSRGLRVSPEDFETRDFRVNSLLADVPLHDVWAIDLKGNSSPTLDDLGNAFRLGSPLQASPAVTGLGMVRVLAGLALGWEDPRWFDSAESLLHRLTEADRRRSTAEPGTTLGIWRVLYAFPREGAVETMNGTAHVAVAAALAEDPHGPRLYLSFRVRHVNWTTPFYMRLIDPARRYFVYPSLLRQFAHTWEGEDWKRSGELRIGEKR